MYLDCSLFIIVIKAIQPDCDKIKGISVLLLEPPLTRSKYFSPYTPTTSHANSKNLLHIRVQSNSSLVENLMSCGRRDKFWIISSRMHPYSDFSKHSGKSRTVASNANPIQGRVHTHTDLRSTKEKR